MRRVPLQLGKLPIQITCWENGCVSFDRYSSFNVIIDSPEVGVQAIISNEDIVIGADTVIEYGQLYEYKEMPELLAWLQAFEITMPKFKKGI